MEGTEAGLRDGLADPSVLETAHVVEVLATDPDRGLASTEAATRLARSGPNELVSAPPVPTWRKLLAQLADPLVYLLLVAVAISLVAWGAEGARGVPFDAVVIVVIVVLNAVLGYVQEARAERAVAALQKMAGATAGVVRDGEPRRIPAREVVPGDVLVLAEGDTVSADARLVQAATLRVAEASLTGESEAVDKSVAALPGPAALGDRTDMVFAGTAVTQGSGRAVVTSTGMGTEMGRIADLLGRTEQEPTPLQREIAHVGRLLGVSVVVIAVIVIGTVFLTSDIRTASDAVSVLLLGVSLAVAAVPEGLPAILTVVLALGVQRLAQHHAIVKELSSVETLGSASVICSDKTGTLTRNEMTVVTVVTTSGEARVTGVGVAPDGQVLDGDAPLADGPLRAEVTAVLVGGSLANDASLQHTDGEWVIQGDPTEAAFLVAERKLGVTEERAAQFRRLAVVPFTSERKLMSTVQDQAERDVPVVVVKGAPDVLLGRCTRVLVGQDVVPFGDERRGRVLADVERLSAQALRMLAVGFREMDGGEAPDGDSQPDGDDLERDLVYAGMVGIIDPPRSEAREAIAQAHRAGIRTVMITGDHPRTAQRIAADLGLVEAGAPVLTGPELDAMADDPERFTAAVRATSVYARVAPQHKLSIVDALQADGQVVAMTGDGVNDAPALKAADIGVAMGITGTEVAKEAAAMILADDNYATIVRAVREGRAIFDNIRKFLRYLLSSNMGEVLTVFLGVVLAGVIGLTGEGETLVIPLLATQILWINLLTDTGPALAMGVDPQIDDVMGRPPRTPTERVIDARMWAGVILLGTVMAMATLFAIDLFLPGGLVEGSASLEVARTAGFTVLVLAQLYNCINARSETTSAFHQLGANRWLWGAIALSAGLQVLVVHLPVLNTAFGTVPLDLGQWVVCVVLASAVLWVSELRKVIGRAVARRRTAPMPAPQPAPGPTGR